jgi:cytoskeleton protein RodZ
VLDISGLAPFEVTLGAPDAVSITYQGNALDISRYIIDNAARFSVPLEQ